jgi:hypothetical protein
MTLALAANTTGSIYYQDGTLNYYASFYNAYFPDSFKLSPSVFYLDPTAPFDDSLFFLGEPGFSPFNVQTYGRHTTTAFGSSATHGFVFHSIGAWGAPTPHTVNNGTIPVPLQPLARDIPTANRIRSNAYRFPFASYFEIREFANGINDATAFTIGGTASSQENMYTFGGHTTAEYTAPSADSLIYAQVGVNDTNSMYKIPFSVGAPGIITLTPAALAQGTMSSGGAITDGYSAYIFVGAAGVAYSAPLLGTAPGDFYHYDDYAPATDPTPTPLGGTPIVGVSIRGSRRVDRLPFAADTVTIDFGDIDASTYVASKVEGASSPTTGYIAAAFQFGVPGSSGIPGLTNLGSLLKFPYQASTTIAGFASAITSSSGIASSTTVDTGISYSQSEYRSYGTGKKFDFASETEISDTGSFKSVPTWERIYNPSIFESPNGFNYNTTPLTEGFGGINQ